MFFRQSRHKLRQIVSVAYYLELRWIPRYLLQVSSTDLKIDWICHLLLKIEPGVIGPTFFILAFKITFFACLFLLHPYNKYKWNKNAQNVIYNVIYLLKYTNIVK